MRKTKGQRCVYTFVCVCAWGPRGVKWGGHGSEGGGGGGVLGWRSHTGRGHWCRQQHCALTMSQSTKRPCMTGLGQQLMAPNYSFSVLQKAGCWCVTAWNESSSANAQNKWPAKTATSLRFDDRFPNFGIVRLSSTLGLMAPCWDGRDGGEKKIDTWER